MTDFLEYAKKLNLEIKQHQKTCKCEYCPYSKKAMKDHRDMDKLQKQWSAESERYDK